MLVFNIDSEVVVQVLHCSGDILDQLIHHGHAHVFSDDSPQQHHFSAWQTVASNKDCQALMLVATVIYGL